MFSILLFSSLSFSQQQIIDSLTQLLEQNSKPNTERLEVLNELGYHYSKIQPHKGLQVTDEAIILAKQLHFKSKLATAYKNKGLNYKTYGQDSLAIIMYDKALKIYNGENNQIGIAKTIYNKSIIYFEQSNYKLANSYNLQAYKIFKKENDSLLMARMLSRMGVNYMYLTKYPEALSNYLEALKIYENMGTTNSLDCAGNNSNIGLLYNRLKKLELALYYQMKALEAYKSANYQLGIANSLTNIGNIYDNLEKSKLAIDSYTEALDIMKKIGNKRGIANALTNIGIVYTYLSENKIALEHLTQTKVIYKELKNNHNLSIVNKHIGLCYLSMSDKDISQQYRLKTIALRNFKEALLNAKKSGSINLQISALEYISLVNFKIGNYKKAYESKNQWIVLKDSFNIIEKKEDIAKLEAKYEYEKKEVILKASHEKEQAVAVTEISRQKFIKNSSILGGSGFVLASIIGFILYRRKQGAITQTKEAEFKTKVADTELKALRAQMNPHFIFNSLNSIGDYILKNDTQTANDYLIKFSKLIRHTLENSEKKEVLLADDLSLLKTYLDIENKRFNNSFTYNIEIDEDIDAQNTLVPPLILQPFIENSIIHGLALQEGKGHILIEFKKDKDMIICAVDDNGVGRQKSKGAKSIKNKQSLGMKITKSRIEIINKLKKAKGAVTVIDKDKGVRVEVSLPLELAF